jgi:hypothetical protein
MMYGGTRTWEGTDYFYLPVVRSLGSEQYTPLGFITVQLDTRMMHGALGVSERFSGRMQQALLVARANPATA